MKAIRQNIFLITLLIAAVLQISRAVNTSASELYDELRGEFERSAEITYRPAVIFSEAGEPERVKGTPSEEIEKLGALAEKWNAGISGKSAHVVFAIDKTALERAEKAYEDDGEVLKMLADKISLDLLSALAIYRNPMLNAAKDQLKATVERFSQISNLDLIMQEYVSFTQSLSTKVGPQRNKSMPQMKFPFPGMPALKGDIVDKDMRIAQLAYENTQIEALTMVKKAYFELLFAVKEEEITVRTLKLLEELEKVALIKYETGRTSFNDVIKVQIKIEKLKDFLITVGEMKTNLKVKILQLLSLPPASKIGDPVHITVKFGRQLDELYSHATENNRELMILGEKIRRMALMIEMAEKKFYPDFSAGYSYYMDNKIMQTGTAAAMPNFVTAPSHSLEKSAGYAGNDAYIREVKENYKAMQKMYEAKKDQVLFAVKDAYFKIDKSSREESLYSSNLIPKAEETLKVALVGYETGDVSFLDLLDTNMMWLDLNTEYFRAIRDKATSVADMEKLAGSPLASIE